MLQATRWRCFVLGRQRFYILQLLSSWLAGSAPAPTAAAADVHGLGRRVHDDGGRRVLPLVELSRRLPAKVPELVLPSSSCKEPRRQLHLNDLISLPQRLHRLRKLLLDEDYLLR